MAVRAAILSVLVLVATASCLGTKHAHRVGAPITSTDPTDLAKETQNPVSLVKSLSITGDAGLDIEPTGDPGLVLNLRSSFPVRMDDSFNVVNLIDVPAVTVPPSTLTGDQVRGLGDVKWTSYFTLNAEGEGGNVFGGVGPVVSLPTASENELGTGRWAGGLAGVLLRNDGPLVWGASISNIWSVFNSSNPNVSRLSFEPFVHLNFGSGWYLTTEPVITADWEATPNQWVVPVGGGIGRVFYFAEQPLNGSLQVYKNVEAPVVGPEWQIVFELQFIFPYTKL